MSDTAKKPAAGKPDYESVGDDGQYNLVDRQVLKLGRASGEKKPRP